MAFKNQFVKFLRESGVPVPVPEEEEEVEVEKKETKVEGFPGKHFIVLIKLSSR
jgi:hypothetical protein